MYKIDRSKFGKGLFATKNIPKGTIVTKVSGKSMHFRETIELGNKESHTLQIGPKEYLLCNPPFLFSNHSCNPNCGLTADLKLITIRDVEAGEEFLWDYSTSMLERHWEMQCHCGSPECRHLIRDFDLLPSAIQSKYLQLQIVLPFIVDHLQIKAWPLSA